MNESLLLTLILFSPLLGALAVLLVPGKNNRTILWTAFAFSLIPLALSIYMWVLYQAAPAMDGEFKFSVSVPWFSVVHSNYHLGVDGISVPMVILTALLVPLCILASAKVERMRAFMALFFMLETGVLGVFLSLDLLLFFVFYEIGLVPMYFLIFQWGSPKGKREIHGGKVLPAREYASFKFMIYTMAASLGMLLSIQLIGVTMGTFDLTELYTKWVALQPGDVLLPGVTAGTVKAIAFWAFFLAFALKVPLCPLHTWLPDAHTEAPTAGSMILAGVLLKQGAYGFFRLVIPLFPQEMQAAAPIIAVLAMLAIVLGAYAAYGQTDFKRLVAYSSVNHMGFVVLGIAAVAWAAGSTDAGLKLSGVVAGSGAVLQMFNHGLSAAAMFFLVGVVYERTHTRNLKEIGGRIWQYAPIYGGVLIFSSMASLGLPGLNGFVGEFAIIRGAWPIFTLTTILSMLGLLVTGSYILKGIGSVLHGPMNPKWAEEHPADGHAHSAVGHDAHQHDAHGHDHSAHVTNPLTLKKRHWMEITPLELAVVTPLMVLMLLIGLFPAGLMQVINHTVTTLWGK